MLRPRERARRFCDRFGLRKPILLAPMAGACPPALTTAVAKRGAMGAMGALLADVAGIRAWVDEVRRETDGPFQLNTWIPEPAPQRSPEAGSR